MYFSICRDESIIVGRGFETRQGHFLFLRINACSYAFKKIYFWQVKKSMLGPGPVSAFRGKPPANVLMNALGLMTSLPWSPASRGLYCTQVIRPKAFMRTLAGLASSADWLAYCIKNQSL